MLRQLHHRLATFKGLADPAKLSDWKYRELLSLGGLMSQRLIRGLILRMRIRRSLGPILCERGVRIYHPRYISAGAWLNLEEGCELVGLSKKGIVFGKRCTVGRFATVRPTNVLFGEPGEGMAVGDYSNIGAYSYIGCSGYVEIGRRVLMGPRVNIQAENHLFDKIDIPIQDQGVERSFVRIEDNCWIGSNSSILTGVSVGTGSVVAAGSVVTKDVPAYSVVAGVPAKILRTRVHPEQGSAHPERDDRA